MSDKVRTKYYRTIDVADIYECQVNDVTRALKDGMLKGHKRARKWCIPIDQPEAFEAFSKWTKTIEHKPKIEVAPKPAKEPEKKLKKFGTPLPRPIGVHYLEDKDISMVLIPEIAHAKKSIKIATSNFKNLFIKRSSIFDILERKVNEGVKVQILCMDINPGADEEMRKHSALMENKALFKLKICPRSHMKMMAFDYETAYVGSANLTNAAIGSRKDKPMNFENGIITDNENLVVRAIGHFDKVWLKSACDNCESKLCSKNQ